MNSSEEQTALSLHEDPNRDVTSATVLVISEI